MGAPSESELAQVQGGDLRRAAGSGGQSSGGSLSELGVSVEAELGSPGSSSLSSERPLPGFIAGLSGFSRRPSWGRSDSPSLVPCKRPFEDSVLSHYSQGQMPWEGS